MTHPTHRDSIKHSPKNIKKNAERCNYSLHPSASHHQRLG